MTLKRPFRRKSRRVFRKAPPGYRWVYRTTYRHYRTGKIMRARDYGYKAWFFLAPFLAKNRRKRAA
jgi:hypothetical protein